MKYYPAFLDLKNKKAVVIGGGSVAERKVRFLVNSGASVKLISPEITAYLRKLSKKGGLHYVERKYRKGDLNGAFIVIAATSSAALNSKIAREAENLVNVINAPSEGNFIVPSVVRRGSLNIAISTEGVSPAVSKEIRKELERFYDREFEGFLKFAEMIRLKAMKEIKNDKKRAQFLKSLASEQLFHTLRKSGLDAVRTHVSKALEKISQTN